MKTELVAVIAIALLASGCASNSVTPEEDTDAPQQPDQEPEDSSTDDQSDQTNNGSEDPTVVTYTDSGFQPSTVTIQQGETVKWESEASRSMWVGSNRHPAHTNYDGTSTREHCVNGEPETDSVFDQCSTGQSFTFTFEKTGTWNYHNHQFSGHQGTVVVE